MIREGLVMFLAARQVEVNFGLERVSNEELKIKLGFDGFLHKEEYPICVKYAAMMMEELNKILGKDAQVVPDEESFRTGDE